MTLTVSRETYKIHYYKSEPINPSFIQTFCFTWNTIIN